MNKLMRANFARLMKDKVFWICIAFMFIAGIFGVVQKYVKDPGETPDQLLFIFPVLIGIVTAAFSSLFIGTEYSDGTIRNKLIVGHKRSSVYLSNFLTCSAAGIIMCLSYIAAVAALGFPLLGLPKVTPGSAMILLFISFMMVISFCALFTLLCMLNQSKATSAVICIIMIVAMLVVASLINSKLDAPQFYDSYSISDSVSDSSTEKVVNPDYLTGTKREIYQFMLDFLPSGQSIEISSYKTPHLWQMSAYSFFIAVSSTAAGMFCFRKKDLK